MGGPNVNFSIDESIRKLVRVIEAQTGKGGLQYLDYRESVVPW